MPSKTIDNSNHQTKTCDSNGTVHSGGSGHFDLPPPPQVDHTTVAEQVCGIGQSDKNPPQHGSNTNNDTEWKSSQSTLSGNSSSDEFEELSRESLQELNKQVYIM